MAIHIRRREFIVTLGGATVAWPMAARAQQVGSIPKIGLLWPAASPPAPPRMEALRQGLHDTGLVEGRDFLIELRLASSGIQQLPELAAELVRMKVDVIHASGDLAPRAAQQATSTIPIVAISDDILGAGLITSLSRPGGNTTGLTILSPELSAKRLEVLKDIIPKLSRVASLWDPTTGKSQVKLTESAAQSLSIELRVFEVQHRNDLPGAFEAAKTQGSEALNVFSSPFLASLHRDIIDLAAKHRFPAIYQWREHAEAGGLISYGPSLAAMWRQTATIVAKVLHGAKAADIPVEQPTKFELVVNTKTAHSLGLAFPPSILLRADEVIE
jgi:putative ABC transport system substrate-binding protein